MILAHHEAGPVLLPALFAFASYTLFALRLWWWERRHRKAKKEESNG